MERHLTDNEIEDYFHTKLTEKEIQKIEEIKDPSRKKLTIEEIKKINEIKNYSSEKLKGIFKTRILAFIAALMSGTGAVIILPNSLPSFNPLFTIPGLCLAVICVAICAMWKQILETDLSPREEEQLLDYLKEAAKKPTP